MQVLRAKKEDLPAVQDLLRQYGSKMTAEASLFNHRDIALQVREDSGQLVGFIWVGLMAKNTIGYIDKFVVHPDFHHKRIGLLLIRALRDELKKRGVRTIFGLIKQDQYHDSSAINALRGSMGAHDTPYTFVDADVAFAESQLMEAGVL